MNKLAFLEGYMQKRASAWNALRAGTRKTLTPAAESIDILKPGAKKAKSLLGGNARFRVNLGREGNRGRIGSRALAAHPDMAKDVLNLSDEAYETLVRTGMRNLPVDPARKPMERLADGTIVLRSRSITKAQEMAAMLRELRAASKDGSTSWKPAIRLRPTRTA